MPFLITESHDKFCSSLDTCDTCPVVLEVSSRSCRRSCVYTQDSTATRTTRGGVNSRAASEIPKTVLTRDDQMNLVAFTACDVGIPGMNVPTQQHIRAGTWERNPFIRRTGSFALSDPIQCARYVAKHREKPRRDVLHHNDLHETCSG